MPNVTAEQLLDKKKKQSQYVTLEDGEAVEGDIVSIKEVTKQGFGGDEIEVLRIMLKVEYPEVGIVQKSFDNGSQKWLNEVVEKGLDVGDRIRIHREGEKTNTKYTATILLRNGQPYSPEAGQQGEIAEAPKNEEAPAPTEE